MRIARLTAPLVSALKEPRPLKVGFSYARICRCGDLGAECVIVSDHLHSELLALQTAFTNRANDGSSRLLHSPIDELLVSKHPFSDAATVHSVSNLASALVCTNKKSSRVIRSFPSEWKFAALTPYIISLNDRTSSTHSH